MTQEVNVDPVIRFLTFRQLAERGIPWSREHLHRLEKAGLFPRKVWLGPKTSAWREDEIDAWSAARPSERRRA